MRDGTVKTNNAPTADCHRNEQCAGSLRNVQQALFDLAIGTTRIGRQSKMPTMVQKRVGDLLPWTGR
jgi:hypothetical protein